MLVAVALFLITTNQIKMKHLFTLIALFGLSLFAQTVPNYVPTNGLVGWWPFNGNANDLSGNGNNGTVNGATLSNDRNGVPQSAYSFNGQNQFIEIPNFSSTATGSITISFWAKVASVNNYQVLLSFGPKNQNGHFEIYSFINTQNLSWHTTGACQNLQSNFFIADNNWHHIVVYSNNQLIKFYVDNSLIGTYPCLGLFNTQQQQNLLFGKVSGPLPYSLNGSMDNIGIWNRALTPAEIQNLYFSCSDTLAAQPVSNNASLGTNASFTASSSASGATYQWQGKSGNSFVNLSNAGQFSGVTTGTLTVSGVTSANNGSKFRCIVDHGDCVDTSDVATLTACFDLTNQPSDRYVVAGTSTTFGLTTNDPSNCTYQWQTNSGFGYQNLSNAGQYSGTTSSTLAVANVSATNNNQLFRCIVTAGTCKDTTSEVRIILSGVGVSENSLQRVSVFPNPTRGLVDLGIALEGTYTLIGIDGRAVQTGALRQILDFSNQPAGVYSLRLETPAGSRMVKVVKE
jgi:hypothetical protein